jgi:hypothetical protein
LNNSNNILFYEKIIEFFSSSFNKIQIDILVCVGANVIKISSSHKPKVFQNPKNFVRKTFDRNNIRLLSQFSHFETKFSSKNAFQKKTFTQHITMEKDQRLGEILYDDTFG